MSAAEALVFTHPFWTWLAVGGLFLIGELLSGSGWLLWPAGAAAAVAVVARFVSLNAPSQIVLFMIVAVVATYVGRRYLPPAPKGQGDINDPTPRLVGQQGETVSAFQSGLGRVFVDGKEWAAELDGGGDLAAKAKVEVVEILGGARLKVKAA
jgi:membrane protein implicated in regulation of membrane protease activity